MSRQIGPTSGGAERETAATPSERYNRRLGLLLFALYFVVYTGFVALTAIRYESTGSAVFLGLNLAVVYGFALIIGAFALSILYMCLARRDDAGLH